MGDSINSKNSNFQYKSAKGVVYEVVFRKPDKRLYGEECDGVCENPSDKNPKIFISPYLTKQSELNTCIHEIAHAFFWDKTEAEIYKFANTASRFLYNECGWRKTERSRKAHYRGKTK